MFHCIIATLWELNPEEFNAWRRENDLPLLLDLFKRRLPHFDEWLRTYDIERVFSLAPRTGRWFVGNKEKQFVEFVEDGEIKHVICDRFDEQFASLRQHKHIEKRSTVTFVPYLSWGTRRVGKKRFIVLDARNNQYSSSIEYRGWLSDGKHSRATLLDRFSVLKLGQFRIKSGVELGRRNLDFVDLDFLEITGDWHGPYKTEIHFSSCRRLKIVNGSVHHVLFRKSNTEEFSVERGRIQDVEFDDCKSYRPSFVNVDINGLTFRNAEVAAPLFERCSIHRFEYIAPSGRGYTREKENHRVFRVAFQEIGKTDQARKYYYKERCFERKSLFSPYLEHRNEFPPMKYAGRLSDLFNHWKDEYFDTRKSAELLLGIVVFHLRVWLIPKYFFRALKFKVRYAASLVEYLLWGYGEIPVRVLGVALLVVMMFSVVYYNFGPPQTARDAIDSVYFSIVTFTTLGYGEIQPHTEQLKIVCGAEAFTGAFLMGLFIAGFANRARY